MIGWLGVGILLAAVVIAPSAVAQLPMSPVYRADTNRPAKPDKSEPIAKDTAPTTAERLSETQVSPVRPEAVEEKPVATAPIPPLPSRNAGKDSEDVEAGSRPPSTTAEHSSATTTTPSPRSASASGERASGVAPSIAAETAATRKPGAAPGTPAFTEMPAGEAVATPREGEANKAAIRKGRRQARTSRHARRPGPAYYYPPPAYYAPSPYSGASRGYGGGAYGPSPYSSDGP